MNILKQTISSGLHSLLADLFIDAVRKSAYLFHQKEGIKTQSFVI
ncbi:hypothetical protein M3I01_018405 [Marinomonas sp. RSW2]|uniref:Uncharacterized protein n=1 Tax=Marinomonas maritima TaxID=2940935 RepID=A0ABT5WJ38_9GAMM|nr:hypothetical protein [Marinomonas maritima]MDE8604837.1 hypothetical protein [Marinomonas maritima]